MHKSVFLSSRAKVEEGDTVIVYVNFGTAYAVTVKRGQTLTMKYGALRHEFLIGKPYGSRISATAGYVHVLRASPELWTRTLPHRTQILYTPDIALIIFLLDLRPGSVVLESGTGSGSLTHALARTVAPDGKVFSFDVDEQRVKGVQGQLKLHELADIVDVQLRNVCSDGFTDGVLHAHGVFLDLPCPWEAVDSAKQVLCHFGGRFVSFSPCIEQSQKTCIQLQTAGFVQIESQELVPRSYKVIEQSEESLDVWAEGNRNDQSNVSINQRALMFPMQQPTHTGYLTSATLLPF